MTPGALRQSASYGGDVHEPTWPDAWEELIAELSSARGRLGLIAADSPEAADDLVTRLRHDVAPSLVSLGRSLADSDRAPTRDDMDRVCGDAVVIADIDVLLSPALRTPVIPFLTARSRRYPTVAVWPGEVIADRAIYSAHGRRDHLDVALRDVVVLRPCSTWFPDEVPFRIERIAS